jgi:nitrogen fixation protein NifB
MEHHHCQNKQYGHPCFDTGNHGTTGRIHLPVAPRCNIQCKFCSRKHDCANENRPGVTSKIITPAEALDLVERTIKNDPRIRVAGIAGPGDPLANKGTFETLALINQRFPDLTKCLSTNGLLLLDSLDALIDAGLNTLTVTINALTSPVGAAIYSHIEYRGRKFFGEEAAGTLFYNQINGIKEAIHRGLRVKVNSVLIPGINDRELPALASVLKRAGVRLMNIVPLIPQADMVDLPAVPPGILNSVRDNCERYVGQFRHCKQCRADAIGIPGLEGFEKAVPAGK